MIKRKILLWVSIMAFIGLISPKCEAVSAIPQKDTNVNISVENYDIENPETDRITKVTFREKFKKTPEAQINSFFKKYNKYSSSNNEEKLKELYSDNYLNNDGFNKEIVFKMMDMAGESYKNVKYVTEIKNIAVDGNFAVVKIHETATGETTKKIEKFKDNGAIKSDIYYINYLKKEGTDWKITNSYILNERVELKYGEAKNAQITIKTPDCVTEGSEYEAIVNTETPDGVFVVGSIVNEPIVYPQIDKKDVFRPIKKESLSRIVKANTDGNNEYATASIAITRAQVEPSSVVINMTGMAFVMKRVNVLSINKNVKSDKEKIDAEASTTQKNAKATKRK